MALLATGRRLPVLRELVSALATTQSGSGPLALTKAALFSTATDKPANKPAEEGAQQEAAVPPAGSSEPATPSPTSSVQQGSATAAAPATQDDDEWTEVIHSSGQIYYWNERTGETTQLGQPKPQSNRGKGGAGGSGGAGGGGAGGAGTSEGRAYDPRAEAPLEDRTGTYAAVGLIVGAFLGWVSQFV